MASNNGSQQALARRPVADQPARGEDEDAARLRMLTARLFRRLERTRAGAALTPAETTVLATIARDGQIGLSELAGAEAINPTMLSRVVRRLEQDGYVARREDPADRRAAIVAATASGSRLLERVRAERSDALSTELARLSPDDRATVHLALPLLERVAEQLRGRRP